MSSNLYTIGLDLGTSSAKGALVSADNTIIAEGTVRVNYRRDAGYIGFDGAAFADDVIGLIRSLAAKLPEGGKVTGIAAVCAAGNTMLLDADIKPLVDVVSWTNDPMQEECDIVFSSVTDPMFFDGDVTRARAGWRFRGAFPLGHLAYLKVRHPDEFARTAKVAMSGEYLLWRLCGKWGIDRSTATPFFLVEQETAKYFQPYLDMLGITEDMLPPVGRSGDVLGALTPEAAEACGLTTECIVHLGSFDHPGGAVASGTVNEGDLLVSCGTSWVCLFPTHDRQMILREQMLCDPFLSPEGCWAGMFSITRVGEIIDRAVELYAGTDADRFDRFYKMADEAGEGAGGVCFDPTEGDLPLPGEATAAQLARAVLEGVGRKLRESMARVEANGISFTRAVMAGGPSRNPICRKIVESVIGIPIEYRYGVSSGAVGAAIMARGDLDKIRNGK